MSVLSSMAFIEESLSKPYHVASCVCLQKVSYPRQMYFTDNSEGADLGQMDSTPQIKRKASNQYRSTNSDSRRDPNRIDNGSDEIKDHKCMVCGIGVPASIADVFDWQHMLMTCAKNPPKKWVLRRGWKVEYWAVCKRCMFMQPDLRGGIKLYSVFVSRLPLSVKAEDACSF